MKLCNTCRNAGLCVIRSKLEEQQVLKFPDDKVAIAEMNIESCDHHEQRIVEHRHVTDALQDSSGVADVVAAVLRQMQQVQAPQNRHPVPPGDTSGVPIPRTPQSPTSQPPTNSQLPAGTSFEDLLSNMPPGGAQQHNPNNHTVTVNPDGSRRIKLNLNR